MRTEHSTEGDTMAIADGYWMYIKPLPYGRHRIHFSFTEDNAGRLYCRWRSNVYIISRIMAICESK